MRLRRSEFSVRDLANAAWAFATLGQLAAELFGALVKEARRRNREIHGTGACQHSKGTRRCSMQWRGKQSCRNNLANTAWAFATLNYLNQELLCATAREAQRRAREINAHELAKTVWSLATLGYLGGELLGAGARALTNTVWPFAKAG